MTLGAGDPDLVSWLLAYSTTVAVGAPEPNQRSPDESKAMPAAPGVEMSTFGSGEPDCDNWALAYSNTLPVPSLLTHKSRERSKAMPNGSSSPPPDRATLGAGAPDLANSSLVYSTTVLSPVAATHRSPAGSKTSPAVAGPPGSEILGAGDGDGLGQLPLGVLHDLLVAHPQIARGVKAQALGRTHRPGDGARRTHVAVVGDWEKTDVATVIVGHEKHRWRCGAPPAQSTDLLPEGRQAR